ncbi:uncharacterized protein si:ch211-214p13.7 [Astyanax mexicanus]|uniref:uncharacterized protein si:ch211-214p13.7 n=1 Tax=Astyanax mexicanus TaxID=7994 RepID=UPI0020CADC18|nr:uncharacterized protein si:ch211-214p13.7 [Astyanax mexicanus]
MGNFLFCGGRKEKSKEGETDQESPKEDVLYATIDHGDTPALRQLRDSGSDCDYAVVKLPCEIASKSDNDDGADDYVLMS